MITLVINKGFNTEIQYVTETSYGAGGSLGTAIAGKVLNFNPSLTNNITQLYGLGNGRNASDAIWGNFDVSGSLTYEMADPSVLQYAVGPQSGAGSTASPYILTEGTAIAYAGTVISSFKMEASNNDTSDDSDTYTGCLITDFTINANVSETLKCSFNWIAKTVASDTSATSYTPNTVTPFVMQQGTVKWGSSPTTVAKVQSATISMNNNLNQFRSIGSRFIEQPTVGLRNYTFELTVVMNDALLTTLRDDFYGQADNPVTGITDASAGTGDKFEIHMSEGGSSGDRQLIFYLEDAHINTMSKPVDNGGGFVTVTFGGTANKGGNTLAPIKWYTTT